MWLGKSRLKFEIESYHKKAVERIYEADENQQLIWLKNKSANEQKLRKGLPWPLNNVTEKLCNAVKEKQIMGQHQKCCMRTEENNGGLLDHKLISLLLHLP